ncbi:WS/DGAT/MGAT family O-acyltransferase [Labedaea rhizosphaerae]|uniref:Diacylglycerol O-acyltransferase n=1 Tax=Labedaea rhizosphaerae TaxID=598644 RepID=A0A4R6S2X7_LABRH|nr:wax ester/triacylglycerol synthase family O-acyltransferase [Labedaea rhizosphaerae]TDP93950.1 WS/DGAT/MGAT family acyltransferase [Labedaea rhizosphaerae]
MAIMPVTDSMFLLAESREHPMHVGGLQLWKPPADAGPDYLAELHHRLLATEVRSLFRRRLRGPIGLGQAWRIDDDMDLEYHIRLSALPRPGRVRELLELAGRLHGSLLDRHRPLWEYHLIEGMTDGRFASYTKVHHSLLDGVSALRLLAKSLSTDPDARELLPPWGEPPASEKKGPRANGGPLAGIRGAAKAVGELAGLAPALWQTANDLFREQSASTLASPAPRSMLNVPITGARRFAADQWDMDRIRKVSKAAGATLNDVMLAMCSGALRRYLLSYDALPERPLVAGVPVSLRARKKDSGDSGNAVGLILCNLATDQADPATRLAEIHASMTRGKEFYAGMSPLQITALSALPLIPLAVGVLPGGTKVMSPRFNVLISNVPGPPRRLYWNGAELDGIYPVSIPYEGQALNITVTSYAGRLAFGLTGCRRTVPHLQRLLGYLEDSLTELEKATSGV